MDKIVEYSVLLGIFASIAMIFFLLIYIVKKPSIFDKGIQMVLNPQHYIDLVLKKGA